MNIAVAGWLNSIFGTVRRTVRRLDRRLLHALLLAAGLGWLTGCGNSIPQPILPADIQYSLSLSTNLVVVNIGSNQFTSVRFSNLVSAQITLPTPGGQVLRLSDGRLYDYDGVDISYRPGDDTVYFPGDTVITVLATVKLTYASDPKSSFYDRYASTASAEFVLRVVSSYQQIPPPPSPPPPAGFAQVASFGPGGIFSNAPANLIEGSDGFFYGYVDRTNSQTQRLDQLVKFDKAGTREQVLATFEDDSPVGSFPIPELSRVSLVDGDGLRSVLIGATRIGPTPDAACCAGAVFRIGEDGTNLEMLHGFEAFNNLGQGGYPPNHVTTDRHGYIYVTTQLGGYPADNSGTISRLLPSGNGFRKLKSFRASLGRLLGPPLAASDGQLYGISEGSQVFVSRTNYTPGNIFTMDIDGSSLEATHVEFERPPQAPFPPNNFYYYETRPRGGLLEASDGFLYGAHGFGLQFPTATYLETNVSYFYRVAKDGTGLTKLTELTGRLTPVPLPLVEGSDGRLYGALVDERSFHLMALDRQTHALELVQNLGPVAVTFENSITAILAASDGAIYGVSARGGDFGRGFLFRYMPSTNQAGLNVTVARMASAANGERLLAGSAMPAQPSLPKSLPLTTAQAVTLGTNFPGTAAGRAIALSADWLAVGVPFARDLSYKGAVHLLQRSGTNWLPAAVLEPQGTGAELTRLFGYSLSLSTNTLAVGAPGLGASNLLAGAVYVFTLTNNAWTQTVRLSGLNNPVDEFGAAVSLDGPTLVVGAPGEFSRGTNSGGAWVFVQNASGTWINRGHIEPTDGAARDYFGAAVAVSGNYAVVGAPRGREDEFPSERGTAYVLQRVSSTAWALRIGLDSDFTHAADFFGASVAISSNVIAVGMPGALPTDPADPNRGRRGVVLFTGQNNLWTETAHVVPESAVPLEMFGASLAFTGRRLTVGAPFFPGNGTGGPGSAYVFDGNAGKWTQRSRLQSPTGQPLDAFGFGVALAGDTTAVTAMMQTNASAMTGGTHLFNLGEVRLSYRLTAGGIELHWETSPDAVLETTKELGTAAQWHAVELPTTESSYLVPTAESAAYFRLRQP